VDPVHKRLAQIGLQAAQRYGFALAGGYADAGFDRLVLAEVFGVLTRYPDRRFAAYGATDDHIAGLRARFATWRDVLLGTAEQG